MVQLVRRETPRDFFPAVVRLRLDVTPVTQRDAIFGDVSAVRHFGSVGDVVGVEFVLGAVGRRLEPASDAREAVPLEDGVAEPPTD